MKKYLLPILISLLISSNAYAVTMSGSPIGSVSYWKLEGSTLSPINSSVGVSIPSSLTITGALTVTGGCIGCAAGSGLDGNWVEDSAGSPYLRLATTSKMTGFGTTTPYAKISIDSGSVGTTTLGLKAFASQTAPLIEIRNSDGALISVLTSSNKLGIGTSSPSEVLSVQGGALISNKSYFPGGLSVGDLTASGTVSITNISVSYATATGMYASDKFIVGGRATTTGSNGNFETLGTLTVSGLTTLGHASTSMISMSSFISTASSTIVGSLQVSGNATLSGTLNVSDKLTAGNASSSLLTVSDTVWITNKLLLATNTPSVNHQLAVQGNSLLSGNLSLANLTATGTVTSKKLTVSEFITGALVLDNDLSINGGDINLGSGTATTTLTSASGKLGIGSTTPQELLSVQGNVIISGNLTSAANITATGTLTMSGTTGTSTIASGQGLTVGSSQLVVIGSNGYVGIGTTSPSAKLSVNGHAYIDGGLSIDGASVNNENGTLLLKSLTSNPTAKEGLFYYDSTNKTLRMSDGTSWMTVGTTTSGFTLSGDRLQLSTLETQYLSIGTTSPILPTLVTIQATSSNGVPLSIMGVDGQSVDLLQIKNGNYTELFAVDPYGHSSSSQLTLSSQLWVTGASSFTGDMSVVNIAPSGTLTVTGKTTVGSASSTLLTVSDTAWVSSKLLVGTTTASETFAVKGNSLFNGDISVANLTATGTITSANATLTALTVSGDQTINGKLSIASTTPSVNHKLSVQGNGAFNGNLTASNITATGTVATPYLTVSNYVVGNLKLDGNLQIPNGTLYVDGAVSFSGGTLNFGSGSATATISSASEKIGIATTSPSELLSVHGNAFISGDLSNVANIKATGTLSVTGLSSLGYASTTGISLTKNLMVNGMATTSGATGNIDTQGTVTSAKISTTEATSSSLYVSDWMNIANGKSYRINGTAVLSGTTLGSGVTASSLTSLGTLTSLTVSGHSALATASTTMITTGGFISTASSTITDNLHINGRLGIATSSPSTELSISGAATTTIYLDTTSLTQGSCIEMKSPNGTVYGVIVANSGTLTAVAGACK